MKRVSEPCIELETIPFPRVVADHKSRWWKGQSCQCQQQDRHPAAPFLVFLVLFLVFPSFLSRVSSSSQNKLFGGFLASFLHPQPPVGTFNSKPQHHASPRSEALARSNEGDFSTSYSLNSGDSHHSSSGFDAQLADIENMSPSLETQGATAPQISSSTSLVL